MGIVSKTISICTCDLCGAECNPNDGIVVIQVDPGDGRDVGPGHLTATLRVNLPYRCSDGIVCAQCKMKWLRAYVATPTPEQASGAGGEND